MESRVFQSHILLICCLFLTPGTSIAEKPPFEVIRQGDPGTIPIVNPTTPSTQTPIANPTNPVSPPAPLMPNPNTNPAPTTTTPMPSTGAWCIASPTASATALQVALDYACGYGGADCAGIQPGASCYDPNTVRDHASYAFNDYYQKNPVPTSCVFGGTAQLSYTDPSSGNCHYAAPRTTPVTTPSTTPIIPPPSMTPPFNPYAPGGQTGYGSEPTDYGAEPTGTPNSAKIFSSNVLQFFMTTWIILLLVENHI